MKKKSKKSEKNKLNYEYVKIYAYNIEELKTKFIDMIKNDLVDASSCNRQFYFAEKDNINITINIKGE